MRVREDYGATDPGLASAAALMADGARAAMLTALLDGRALPAGQLARLAGVRPSTASAHLRRLLDGGLVSVTTCGRQRYYVLAGHEVAAAIEAVSRLGPVPRVRSLRQSRQAAALAEARMCYDHLAGRAGVALLDGLLTRKILAATGTQQPAATSRQGPSPAVPCAVTFDVTAHGAAALAALGVDVGVLRRSRRRFAFGCLDWTERRAHLAGAVGAGIAARLLELDWIEAAATGRAVRVTPAGREGLAETFGWTVAGALKSISRPGVSGAGSEAWRR